MLLPSRCPSIRTPLDSVTVVPAGTPVDMVFTGAQDDVLADHPLHDGG